MAWPRKQMTSHYLKRWWSSLLTHICVTLAQWVNQFYICYQQAFYTVGVRQTSMGMQLSCVFYYSPRPGAYFANDVSIVIQIQWKYNSSLTHVLVKWSLWNFAHGTTAVLSCYVQNFVAVWYPTLKLHKNQFSIEVEIRRKNRCIAPDITRCMSVNCIMIGSDNGLALVCQQSVTWAIADLLSIEPLGTWYCKIVIKL